jgi:hypothetical protein
MNVHCPYCGDAAELVTGDTVYPHRADLHSKRFYRCVPCGARVGCHKGTDRPLGRLANAELRRAKMAAHDAFDKMWKLRRMTRNEAYGWLANELNLSRKECHIGMFDVQRCEQVVRVCGEFGK